MHKLGNVAKLALKNAAGGRERKSPREGPRGHLGSVRRIGGQAGHTEAMGNYRIPDARVVVAA